MICETQTRRLLSTPNHVNQWSASRRDVKKTLKHEKSKIGHETKTGIETRKINDRIQDEAQTKN